MSQVSDLSRQIWLLLLSRGGWWAPREVDLELGLTPGSALQRMLKLKKYGTLKHRAVQARPSRGEYAVLPSCPIPEGVTVGEVVAALSTATTPAATPTPAGMDTSTWLSPAELEFGSSKGLLRDHA